jgi:hypothetical protein
MSFEIVFNDFLNLPRPHSGEKQIRDIPSRALATPMMYPKQTDGFFSSQLGESQNACSSLPVKNSDAAGDTPSNRAAKARTTLGRSRAATPSPSPTEGLTYHALQSPRLDRVQLTAAFGTAKPCGKLHDVCPIEMRGSQLIGLSRIMRHRGP